MLFILSSIAFVKTIPELLGTSSLITVADNPDLHLVMDGNYPVLKQMLLKPTNTLDPDVATFIGVGNKFNIDFNGTSICVDSIDKRRVIGCNPSTARLSGLWTLNITADGVAFVTNDNLCLTRSEPDSSLLRTYSLELAPCSSTPTSLQLFDIKPLNLLGSRLLGGGGGFVSGGYSYSSSRRSSSSKII
ncbi:hypothetical protein TCON_1523 [Astathelohania contejeani]|uniref:Uncharacterized protein n=1 Tax=Astathelohania contejeani TaxID=164912 RepID=A0ABQ7HYL8_9MICR|nr:hypothetical protein TCON_1523 [Thelohania contejeani]